MTGNGNSRSPLYPNLSSSVKDVQKTWLRVDDCALLIRVLDGGVVVVDEVVLDILQGEGGLAHPAVAEHHDSIPGRNRVWFPTIYECDA